MCYLEYACSIFRIFFKMLVFKSSFRYRTTYWGMGMGTRLVQCTVLWGLGLETNVILFKVNI